MPVSTKDSSPMDLVLKTAPHQTKTVSFSLQEPFNAAKWSSPILFSDRLVVQATAHLRFNQECYLHVRRFLCSADRGTGTSKLPSM